MGQKPENKPCVAPLENSAQQYAWGDTGGIVPFIEASAGPGFPIGEVWMGSHERAPSGLVIGGAVRPLDELIREEPRHWLGEHTAARFRDMPYLFKVLAASTPLSLQVHPNHSQAHEGFDREELSGLPRSAPERTFKDPRHKPELAVALTPFTAMAGFRSPEEVARLLGPALAERLGFSVRRPEDFREFIRRIFSLRPENYGELERTLTARARELAGADTARERGAGTLVLELQELYPHDSGQFGPLLFDILNMRPGEALYVPAGVIHAYVRGSILEIMACSDNVIRAGLTIKYVDVGLLCDILDPAAVPALVSPELMRTDWGERAVYHTPAEEFRLEKLTAGAPGGSRLELEVEGPEILLCTEGSFSIRAGENRGRLSPSPPKLFAARQTRFVAGACRAVTLEGSGTIWRAAVGWLA